MGEKMFLAKLFPMKSLTMLKSKSQNREYEKKQDENVNRIKRHRFFLC